MVDLADEPRIEADDARAGDLAPECVVSDVVPPPRVIRQVDQLVAVRGAGLSLFVVIVFDCYCFNCHCVGLYVFLSGPDPCQCFR